MKLVEKSNIHHPDPSLYRHPECCCSTYVLHGGCDDCFHVHYVCAHLIMQEYSPSWDGQVNHTYIFEQFLF